MNSLKEINIKSRSYYFFDDVINIKTLGLNKTIIDKMSCKNILIYCIGYVMVKDLT